MCHVGQSLLEFQLIQGVWGCLLYLWMCSKASVTKGQLLHFFLNIQESF